MKLPPRPNVTEAHSAPSRLPAPPVRIAELQWLLLIIIAFYLVAPGTRIDDSRIIAYALAIYLVFVVIFRGATRRLPDAGLKLVVQIWAMIALITAVLWQSGLHDSVMLNLYLLPLAVSAAQLDHRSMTAHVSLIAVCYLLLAWAGPVRPSWLALTSRLLAQLGPIVLVAFVVGRLAREIREAHERIHTLSETDELTGLWNMRAFNRMHRREHQRSERHSRPYSLMMLDMDNLKAINDTYGHEAGNRAIQAIARALARITRVTDAAARFGGDEFIVLLHEADRQKAAEVARRIRRTLAATEVELEGTRVQTSASVGYASYPSDATEPKQLFSLADRRMYEQKRRSRGVEQSRAVEVPSTD